MLRSLIIALLLLLLLPAPLLAATPRDLLLLAWSQTGEHALVQETVRDAMGGASVSYRVVGPGVLQQRHEVSNDMVPGDGPRLQRVSKEQCRTALLELKKILQATGFKGVELHGENCAKNRSELVLVTPELAESAETSELETDGEAFIRRDWRIRFQLDALVLMAPGTSKRLLLPRRIAPEAAHLLLSPTRRLLLVLSSTETGEQVLTAGFSSHSGSIADFQ